LSVDARTPFSAELISETTCCIVVLLPIVVMFVPLILIDVAAAMLAILIVTLTSVLAEATTPVWSVSLLIAAALESAELSSDTPTLTPLIRKS